MRIALIVAITVMLLSLAGCGTGDKFMSTEQVTFHAIKLSTGETVKMRLFNGTMFSLESPEKVKQITPERGMYQACK